MLNDVTPQNPTSINLTSGNINLVNPLWDAGAPINATAYGKGPNPYQAIGDREVESFTEPVPFP